MTDLECAIPTVIAKKAPARRAGWFDDLRFTLKGIVDRRTGRTITLQHLAPREIFRFAPYFVTVFVESFIARSVTRAPLRVWFEPERPPPWYIVWSAMALSGLRFASDAESADVSFYFEDKTIGAPLKTRGALAINGACRDISKTRVAEVFGEIAGYPLAIDPGRHAGPAVEKSEENGAHDGRVVICPTLRVAGKSYQLLIDSADVAGCAIDYRTTIIASAPACVLVKSKPLTQRFSIHNSHVAYQDVEEVFAPDEVGLLTRFCEAIGLDWGALDVLRDASSGRLYVVDVNKTDTGPAADLSPRDRAQLKKKIATGLRRLVRDRAAEQRTGMASAPACR